MPQRRIASRRRRLSVATALSIVALLFATPGYAQSESPHRLHWQSNWRRVGGVEYALTTGLFATFVAVWFLPPLETAIWTSPVLLDRATRRGLRAHTRGGRNLAAGVSDGIATLSYIPPLLLDPFIVAGIDDRNPDVAWELFVISTQSYAITLTANSIAKRVFARQRPYARSCARDPDYSNSCENADRFRAFYSGHAAVTATSAGLICAHHTHLPLYGGGIYDSATCAAAVTGMLATGTLRMVADKHWHSDVFVGHLLGFSVGYLLPTLLYYRGFRPRRDPPQGSASTPLARSSPVLTASFQF